MVAISIVMLVFPVAYANFTLTTWFILGETHLFSKWPHYLQIKEHILYTNTSAKKPQKTPDVFDVSRAFLLSPSKKNIHSARFPPQIPRSLLDMTTVVAMFWVTCVANGTGAEKKWLIQLRLSCKMLLTGMKNSNNPREMMMQNLIFKSSVGEISSAKDEYLSKYPFRCQSIGLVLLVSGRGVVSRPAICLKVFMLFWCLLLGTMVTGAPLYMFQPPLPFFRGGFWRVNIRRGTWTHVVVVWHKCDRKTAPVHRQFYRLPVAI